MKDPFEALRRHREARKAWDKSVLQSEHVQPVIVHAGKAKKISPIQKLKMVFQARSVYTQAKSNNYSMNAKSVKTTVFGASGFLVIASNVVSMIFDGNPDTNPDWSVIIPLAISNIGLLFAKDFNASHTSDGK
jgi:hypothetical protein